MNAQCPNLKSAPPDAEKPRAQEFDLPGSGKIKVNGENFDKYFNVEAIRGFILQPLTLTGLGNTLTFVRTSPAAARPGRRVRSVTVLQELSSSSMSPSAPFSRTAECSHATPERKSARKPVSPVPESASSSPSADRFYDGFGERRTSFPFFLFLFTNLVNYIERRAGTPAGSGNLSCLKFVRLLSELQVMRVRS